MRTAPTPAAMVGAFHLLDARHQAVAAAALCIIQGDLAGLAVLPASIVAEAHARIAAARKRVRCVR